MNMRRIIKYVVLATLVAGVLDIVLACLNVYLTSGRGPEVVLRYIASGMYGTKAFGEGGSFPAIGLLLHFFITFVCVVLYLVFYKNNFVEQHWLLSGIIYGIVISLFMNFVVIPFSETPKSPVTFYPIFKQVVIQVIATGIPIAWLFKYYCQPKATPR
jgi:uncharacterized membrane protein YagU involved in acid resistance